MSEIAQEVRPFLENAVCPVKNFLSQNVNYVTSIFPEVFQEMFTIS